VRFTNDWSLNLFSYHTEANDVTRILWADNQLLPENGTVKRVAFQNYVCQFLNLFEMSVRFRKEKVMPAEVFGSWVIWYYDLFSRPYFYTIWQEVRLNYTCDLRRIADKYFEVASRFDDEMELKKHFFSFVAEEVHDKNLIVSMLGCGDAKISDKNCKKCPSYSANSKKLVPENNLVDRLEIRWCPDDDKSGVAADFFAANVDSSYISHGEFIEGRAVDMNTWRSDLSEIMKKEFSYATLTGSSNDPEIKLALARKGNKMVGPAFLLLHRESKNPYIELSDMVVEKTIQSQGIGSLLLKWIEDEMRKTEINFIFPESGIRNNNAHNFFRKKGYQTVSRVMM
jgi:GNAT superfamily N-acetyltransferase